MKINIMNVGVTYVWFGAISKVQKSYERRKIKCIDYVLCMLKMYAIQLTTYDLRQSTFLFLANP